MAGSNRNALIIEAINLQVPLADYLEKELNYKIHRLPQSVSCPMHEDKKPSMRLYNPKERGAYCFSCGKAYTTYSVHRGLNNWSFKEIVNYFIENYNVDLSSINDVGSQYNSHRLSDKNIAYWMIKQNNHIKGSPSSVLTNFERLADKLQLAYKESKINYLYV